MYPSPHHRQAGSKNGFSLLEVLVAIVVLSIGLMSTAMLMANVYRYTVRSRYMALATQLASEELEDLSRFPNNPNTGYVDPHIQVPAGSNTCGIAGETCIGSLTCTVNVNCPTQNISGTTVAYFDTVALSMQNGVMSETYEMPCTGNPDGTGNYVTLSYSPNGLTPNTAANPALCYASPPSQGMTFYRQWVIEQDRPVVGLRRITVLVTLDDRSVQLYTPTLLAGQTPPPSVTFQMSMVRQ